MTAGDQARTLTTAGVSCIPIVKGSKKAACEWKDYQDHIADDAELVRLFSDGESGIAAICGPISGGLELMDFDVPDKAEGGRVPPAWRPFCELLKSTGHSELLKRLIIQETPSGGRHLVYRCATATDGNQKLANLEDSRVLIETRGRGGYFLIAPTVGYTLKQGSFDAIPELTAAERETLHVCARLQNQKVETVRYEKNHPGCQRPGDDYNLRGPELSELLARHGWKDAGRHGVWHNFTRPGKDDGISAGVSSTTGLFHCFTTSTPFESSKGYNKFSVFCVLEAKGDFFSAAQMLKADGYGVRQGDTRSIGYEQPRAGGEQVVIDDDIRPLSSYAIEEYRWIWDTYLLRGHINLIEGRGETMKSTILTAIAISLAAGRVPITGEECEPIKTLFMARQDSGGELHQAVLRLGGDPSAVLHYGKPLELDPRGLDWLKTRIDSAGIDHVVFDPWKAYFPRWITKEFDNIQLNKFFDAVREVGQDTGAGMSGTRHFVGNTQGRSIEDLGAGGQEWRNSARRQLVVVPHPERTEHYGQVAVFSARGSLNAPRGKPFGAEMVRGEFRWIHPDDLDLDGYAEIPAVASYLGRETKSSAGRKSTPERQTVDAYIQEQLIVNDLVVMTTAFTWADSQGIDRKILYNAVQALGMLRDEVAGMKVWVMPS